MEEISDISENFKYCKIYHINIERNNFINLILDYQQKNILNNEKLLYSLNNETQVIDKVFLLNSDLLIRLINATILPREYNINFNNMFINLSKTNPNLIIRLEISDDSLKISEFDDLSYYYNGEVYGIDPIKFAEFIAHQLNSTWDDEMNGYLKSICL